MKQIKHDGVELDREGEGPGFRVRVGQNGVVAAGGVTFTEPPAAHTKVVQRKEKNPHNCSD